VCGWVVGGDFCLSGLFLKGAACVCVRGKSGLRLSTDHESSKQRRRRDTGNAPMARHPPCYLRKMLCCFLVVLQERPVSQFCSLRAFSHFLKKTRSAHVTQTQNCDSSQSSGTPTVSAVSRVSGCCESRSAKNCCNAASVSGASVISSSSSVCCACVRVCAVGVVRQSPSVQQAAAAEPGAAHHAFSFFTTNENC